jgi:hypothetical protein
MQRTHRTSLAILAGLAGLLSIAAVSCGGKKGDPAAPGEVGGPGEPGVPAGEPGEIPDGVEAGEPVTAVDAGMPPDAAMPVSAVTFVLTNTGTAELALNMDRGWASVVLAWSGKPPKAKPILMFPTFCTASCDAADEERCPLCEQPEKVTDIRAAQKLEKIAPGASLEARWDAQAFVYEKTRGSQNGKTVKCQCWRPAPAPPETYTVRACGLRLTTTVGSTSQLVCAEGKMTLPVSEPVRVQLDFPDPAPPKPTKPTKPAKKKR